MADLIALIILILSLVGIAYILWKKIPVLNQLPEIAEGIQKDDIIGVIKKKIKTISLDRLIFLKTLSKVRVYILRTEKFVDQHLQKMRKKIVKKQEEVKAEETRKENSLIDGSSVEKNKPE